MTRATPCKGLWVVAGREGFIPKAAGQPHSATTCVTSSDKNNDNTEVEADWALETNLWQCPCQPMAPHVLFHILRQLGTQL